MGVVRIAHLMGSNFYGGPERQVVCHATHARQMDYAPCIMSFAERGNPNEVLQRAADSGLETFLVRALAPFDPSSIRTLARNLLHRKIRLLVSHGYKANVVGRLAAYWARIPKIAVSRGWTAESAKIKAYERLDRLFLRLADHVVAVSAAQKHKLLAAGIPSERISVIHNSIDLDEYPEPSATPLRIQLGIPPEAILVATAGRLSPEKDQIALVKAAVPALRRCDSLHFAIFGDGVLRQHLEKMVAERGLGERFHFPGFRSDLRSIMHEVDIFVLPSLTEGLPNVVLEAYACGKPVVATDVGGTPEVVDHGHNGYLIPAKDSRSLAERVVELAQDPEKRKTLGENGRTTVRTHFGHTAQMERYDDLYRRILENPSPRLLCGDRT